MTAAEVLERLAAAQADAIDAGVHARSVARLGHRLHALANRARLAGLADLAADVDAAARPPLSPLVLEDRLARILAAYQPVDR